MSRFFGEIRQVAYLVPDIEAAMDYWARVLGVGPWYYNPKVPIVNYTYRGDRYEPHNSVALANAGGLQIELVQTRNDVPSMYRDFLRAGLKGVQHFAYWTRVSTPILRGPKPRASRSAWAARSARTAALSISKRPQPAAKRRPAR
jgi:Glyoxalase/Bleomycin resistance protein/Dioxygenase superfamily